MNHGGIHNLISILWILMELDIITLEQKTSLMYDGDYDESWYKYGN
jgi:hypothetical protein